MYLRRGCHTAASGALSRYAVDVLGREPSDGVYIADDEDVIRKVVFNDAYHKERENSERWVCMSIALLVLCLETFVGTLVTDAGFGGLVIFGGIAALYSLVVRTRIQNEVEGAVVCFIIVVLTFLLLPAVRAVRQRSSDVREGRTIACNGAGGRVGFEINASSAGPLMRTDYEVRGLGSGFFDFL